MLDFKRILFLANRVADIKDGLTGSVGCVSAESIESGVVCTASLDEFGRFRFVGPGLQIKSNEFAEKLRKDQKGFEMARSECVKVVDEYFVLALLSILAGIVEDVGDDAGKRKAAADENSEDSIRHKETPFRDF